VPEAVAAEPLGEDIALKVVYEDEDIIVIDKPRGLVVHPAAGHETGTLVNALIAHFGTSLSGIGGVKRPGIVHRPWTRTPPVLMVVAKNDRAHQSLSEQFADHGRTGAIAARLYRFRMGRAEPPARQRSTRRSIGIRMRERKWRCGTPAARPSPIGRSRRRLMGGTASRSRRNSPANSKPAAPIRSGCNLAHISHP